MMQPDASPTAELRSIVERRLAEPPPAGSVKPVIRRGTRGDRRALEEMALRCGADSLRRRFHGSVDHLPVAEVARLLDSPRAQVNLVADVGGALVAIGSLLRSRRGHAEIAVLVEDAWQHTGLGHRLTVRLLAGAAEQRIPTVVADVLREPAFLLDRLRRVTPSTTVEFDGPVATVRIPTDELPDAVPHAVAGALGSSRP